MDKFGEAEEKAEVVLTDIGTDPTHSGDQVPVLTKALILILI